MATYRITGPDGAVYNVTAPDDASEQDVLSYVQQNARQPSPSPVTPQQPMPEGPGMGEGFGMGVGDLVHGGAQLLANTLPRGMVDAVNQATAAGNRVPILGTVMKTLGMTPAEPEQINRMIDAREAEYQGRRQAAGETGMDWPRLGGNVAASLPVAAAFPAGASLPAAIGWGAAGSGALSALNPVEGATEEDFGTKKAKQIISGATVGAVTGPVSYMAGRVVSPELSPQVRTLADQGVDMTPGQLLGGGVKRMEDAMTSVPVIGDQIGRAQRASIESFNRAAVNKALEPIKTAVGKGTPVGRELIDEAFTKVSGAYDNLLPGLRLLPDQQLGQDILSAVNNPVLTPDVRNTLLRTLQDKVASRFQPGQPITGETLKKIESELGQYATNYGKSAIASERDMGAAFNAVKAALRDALSRSNPQAAQELSAINQAYAMLARVRGAGASAGTDSGLFTPAQLSAAVRAGDKSVGKGQFARGNALMQEFSDAAKSVMPSSVPDSGTPRRAMAAALAAGGAGASGLVNPLVAGGAMLPLAAYTGPVQRMIQALLTTPRPLPVRAAGTAIAGAGPALGAALSAGLE